MWRKITASFPQQEAGGMKRIVVVGTSGSGKTTLARQLASLRDIPFVELDALHWGPHWTSVSTALLRERVASALSGDTWVVDGNYSKVRDLTWGRADTVLWLDYNLGVVMTRLLRRTSVRLFTREELWHGNQESAKSAFFSRDSILLWALQTHFKNRRQYSELTLCPEYAHLRIMRFRSPQSTTIWLKSVK